MMELGELISLYRRQSGMTIDELAEKSGVPKGTLNKIIGGVTKAPTLDNMKAIARALGKRLSDFDDEPEIEDMFSSSERAHIKKYRILDTYGKEAVNGVLDVEYRRCEADRQEKLASVRAERERTSRETAEGAPTLSLDEKVAELERKNQEMLRQNQELAAKVAAIEKEDALLGLTDEYSASPMVSVGNIRPGEKVKK